MEDLSVVSQNRSLNILRIVAYPLKKDVQK